MISSPANCLSKKLSASPCLERQP